MLIGINVPDAFLLANYHKVINIADDPTGKQKRLIRRFAGILSLQLIRNAKHLGSLLLHFAPEDDSSPNVIPVGSITEPSSAGVLDTSSPGGVSLSDKQAIHVLQDTNGKTNYLVEYDITKNPSGHCKCKKQKCKRCYETG
jgi:hypothetical protein